MKKLIIAIDGPAASGKSTTSKLVAKYLGYTYLDTGAMYRAITLKVLNAGVDISDEAKVSEIAENTKVSLKQQDEKLKVYLDDVDVSKEIRSVDVTRSVSAVSSYKLVREFMVREQRRMSQNGGIVVEGRDIGTVVFPDADLKIFMVASAKERARRRQKELEDGGTVFPLEQLIVEIKERDRKDSQRTNSPLKRADDAEILDTSNLSIDEQVKIIVNRANKILMER